MKSVEEKILDQSEYFNHEPSLLARDMFFYPICVGHFFYENGYSQFRNSYDSYLLMYIISGSFDFISDGKSFQAKASQFIIIDCYKPHGYQVKGNGECYWCHFDGSLASKYFGQIAMKSGNVLSLFNSEQASRTFLKLYNTFSKNEPIREAYISKLINDILTDLIVEDYERNVKSASSLIEDSLAYINTHFTEELTVDQLAKNVALSTFYFIRRFKKETGMTPHEYVLNKRLSSAKYLLKSTELSIKDICFSTGFSSESVFCTAFKQKNGITPAQYRLDLIP